MAKSFTQRKRIRKSFGRLHEATPMPNLIEVQKASYDSFLQINVPTPERTSSGLQAVFESVLKFLTERLMTGPLLNNFVKRLKRLEGLSFAIFILLT